MRQRSRLRDAIEYGLAVLRSRLSRVFSALASNWLARGYAHLLDLALPRLRRVAMANLSMALPTAERRERARIVNGVFRSIARLLVTFARFPGMNRANIGQWISLRGPRAFRSRPSGGEKAFSSPPRTWATGSSARSLTRC